MTPSSAAPRTDHIASKNEDIIIFAVGSSGRWGAARDQFGYVVPIPLNQLGARNVSRHVITPHGAAAPEREERRDHSVLDSDKKESGQLWTPHTVVSNVIFSSSMVVVGSFGSFLDHQCARIAVPGPSRFVVRLSRRLAEEVSVGHEGGESRERRGADNNLAATSEGGRATNLLIVFCI